MFWNKSVNRYYRNKIQGSHFCHSFLENSGSREIISFVPDQNDHVHIQGSYREVWIKFKYFSTISQDYFIVFKD